MSQMAELQAQNYLDHCELGTSTTPVLRTTRFHIRINTTTTYPDLLSSAGNPTRLEPDVSNTDTMSQADMCRLVPVGTEVQSTRSRHELGEKRLGNELLPTHNRRRETAHLAAGVPRQDEWIHVVPAGGMNPTSTEETKGQPSEEPSTREHASGGTRGSDP